MLQSIIEAYPLEEEPLTVTGFDSCIIGLDYSLRIVYSITAIIQQLEDEGMNVLDAYEHFSYNIAGGYVGEKTPIFVYTDFL